MYSSSRALAFRLPPRLLESRELDPAASGTASLAGEGTSSSISKSASSDAFSSLEASDSSKSWPSAGMPLSGPGLGDGDGESCTAAGSWTSERSLSLRRSLPTACKAVSGTGDRCPLTGLESEGVDILMKWGRAACYIDGTKLAGVRDEQRSRRSDGVVETDFAIVIHRRLAQNSEK